MTDIELAPEAAPKRARSGSETRASKAVLVRFPTEDYERLTQQAAETGVTIQELLRRSVRKVRAAPSPTGAAGFALCDGDRARLSDLFRVTSSLAGLLVQAAKGERRQVGQSELWHALEQHLRAIAEPRELLRTLVSRKG